MDPTATTAPAEPPPEPPQVPMLFACAIWVPTFAVVLWFALRLFNRQPILFDRDDSDPDELDSSGPGR